MPTERWSSGKWGEARALLDALLVGVGDDRFARYFRMCATACLHRGLSDEEIARLPGGWRCAFDIAGGPVEVFWQRGVEASNLSAQPCQAMERSWIDEARGLYFPADCGRCPPCQARLAILKRRPKPWNDYPSLRGEP